MILGLKKARPGRRLGSMVPGSADWSSRSSRQVQPECSFSSSVEQPHAVTAFILNWIGMCLMPPTKLERKRSSGPAGSA